MDSKKSGRLKIFLGDWIRERGSRDRYKRNKEPLFYKIAFNYLKGYRNFIYKMDKNGERNLLDKLSKLESERFNTIFDVGANVGNWSVMAAKIFKQGSIYSFEMCPQTFQELQKNTEKYNVNCINSALSDCNNKDFAVNCREGNYTRNSIDFPQEEFYEKFKVPMLTGDSFCANNDIKRINFLKIDVEGHELKVLNGFSNMLRDGNIDIIQFELNEYGINLGITPNDFDPNFHSR